MNKIMQKTRTTILASSILLASNVALASDLTPDVAVAPNVTDQYFYVGTEFGISDPVIKKLAPETPFGKMDVNLKRSMMYGARVGYGFYPGMMLELSYTHQPKYGINYMLPAVGSIPKTPGKTTVKSNVITLNLIYELQKKESLGITPYVIVGAGVAQMQINSATSKAGTTEFFKVEKNKMNCFAGQLGMGFTKDLGNNVNIDLAAKVQYIKDVKIKSSALSMQKGTWSKLPTIKSPILMGEFTIGLTYKFPVN